MNLFGRLSIQSKVMICLIAVSLASILVTSYAFYTTAKEALIQESFDQMTQLQTSRSRQIQSYFSDIRDKAITLAEDPTIVAAMRSFHQEFTQLKNEEIPPAWTSELWRFYATEFIPNLKNNVDGSPSVKTYFPREPATQYLQYHYLAANPYPLGQKSRLNDPKDGSGYSEVHRRYHPFFRGIAERFQYNNFALIDAETENVVYISEKAVGLGNNFIDGSLANSSVAELFETLRDRGEPGSFAISDFEAFRPNYGKPGAFIGSPIFDRSQLIGVLLLHFPVQEINRIMTDDSQWESDGLGKTGETILVGPDYLMRSQSRLLVEDNSSYFNELAKSRVSKNIIDRIKRNNSPILLQRNETEAVTRALAGESGTAILSDYRGISALVSYAPLKLSEEITWAIVAKIYVSEAFAPIKRLSRQIVMTAALLILFVTLASLLLSRQLLSPIYRLIAGVKKMAAGETGVKVSVSSQDEFCQLAGAFNQMSRHLDADKQALETQINENELLLRRVLPIPVVKRLKAGENGIVDEFSSITVLSANLGGFDEGCTKIKAGKALGILNELVNTFDETAEVYEIEKISMIGTAYLAAVGLFVPRLDRDKSAVDYALEMLRIVRRFREEHGLKIDLNVGVHSGSGIGGILGKNRLTYTLLGNTARVARLLAIVNAVEGKPNSILVSQDVYESLHDFYEFTSSGEVEVPGGEKLPVWSVTVESTSL